MTTIQADTWKTRREYERLRQVRHERDWYAERLDAAQLRAIEASNPGIDMDEVRKLRRQVAEAKANPRPKATSEEPSDD